jgi:hypothetical protein
MSQLTLELPTTLYHQLETLAQSEGVSLGQYVVFALTRQATLAYKVHSVPEDEITHQRTAYAALLQSLGKASFAEIEETMQKREAVEPEIGLAPEVVKRLQDRIAKQQVPA